jgi:hypothetical protein
MAGAAEVRVELLLGRRVLDAADRPIGRIEEIRAHWVGDRCLAEEFHLGPAALVERLSASAVVAPLLRLFGRKQRQRRAVRWQDLDLSDPERPRVRRGGR